MNARLRALTLSIVWLFGLTSAPAAAQGFANLGTDADGFKAVTPGVPITFPADYGPHPGYRIEWWYVTANLTTATGEHIGVQWTLFRQASKPGDTSAPWIGGEFWMGHAALTTRNQHFHAEKLARGGIGQAGATNAPVKAWIDDWQFEAGAAPTDGTGQYRLHAAGQDFSYTLDMSAAGDHILHGDAGYSQKSERGQASYYFSNPYLNVNGSINLNGRTTAVEGKAWLDREWSSQPLAADQEGWDWFSMKLGDRERLMLFRLRDKSGGYFYSGTYTDGQSKLHRLTADDISMRPVTQSDVANRQVPTAWQISVPSQRIEVTTRALNPDSWMQTSVEYWEGPIEITGSHKGVGYLEMTGY